MELMTRDEELQKLIEEQAADDREQTLYPEYKGRQRTMSLDTSGDEGGQMDFAGAVYDFEEMVERGDYGLQPVEVVTPHLLNPRGRHGSQFGGVLIHMEHGTYNAYHNLQCRCDKCRAEATKVQRVYRKKRLSQPIPERVHGTYNGYKNYACRCDACCAAHREYQREYRHRRTGRKNSLTVRDQRLEQVERMAEAKRNSPTCSNGHPWTEENTYHRPGGKRQCRQCKRDRYRRLRDAG